MKLFGMTRTPRPSLAPSQRKPHRCRWGHAPRLRSAPCLFCARRSRSTLDICHRWHRRSVQIEHRAAPDPDVACKLTPKPHCTGQIPDVISQYRRAPEPWGYNATPRFHQSRCWFSWESIRQSTRQVCRDAIALSRVSVLPGLHRDQIRQSFL